jgi:hypothetical protein
MNDLSSPAFPPTEPEPPASFKPWEQRIAPGMSGGGGGWSAPPAAGEAAAQAAREAELRAKLAQAGEALPDYLLGDVINRQTELLHYPLFGRQSTPSTDLSLTGQDNAQVWRQFLAEELFDTRRVTLEHFHLFEWFPLAPGRFHTPEAGLMRQAAAAQFNLTVDGRTYYSPPGKASMVQGGVGNVRLRPRLVNGEPHYFLSASSNGVCHEGFPVLVPRRFYGPLKARLNRDGAVPVTLRGEMRYIDPKVQAFFSSQRDLPGLYLHVDEVQVLDRPRPEVTGFLVSVAAAFMGTFQGEAGRYVSYCSFDPAEAGGVARIVQWMAQFYVAQQHQGVVITDFDEVQPRFPGAVFGLVDLLGGQLDAQRVQQALAAQGLSPQSGQQFFVFYKEINTQGGNYFEGPVTVGGDLHGS